MDSLAATLRITGNRDGSTPYDPTDPYWLFKEVAAFECEFHAKVELPLLAAMADRVDQMWDEAIAKAKKDE